MSGIKVGGEIRGGDVTWLTPRLLKRLFKTFTATKNAERLCWALSKSLSVFPEFG